MVDLVQYRCLIGLFRQKVFNQKFLYKQEYFENQKWNRSPPEEYTPLRIKKSCKLVVICVLLFSLSYPPSQGCESSSTAATLSWSWSVYSSLFITTTSTSSNSDAGRPWSVGGNIGTISLRVEWETGNFWARYLHGNINQVKGVHNMHLNIRSLRYKVSEIKNLIYNEKPTILGLSECELKKETLDPRSLKVPGYDLLLPKSWELHGFARVVVYVKKTFHYSQVHDLEDSFVQSIWLKGSYKNCKSLFYCHAYREHASVMGATIANPKDYLNKFLSQWEAATVHNSTSDPNEVHVCCDMNLDYLPHRWLQPSYRLYTLTKLVQNTCNAYNFSQLVTQPTRSMYNSVANTTEVSCIDHIYSNYRHKCSPPRVVVSGASDHDAISYTRFSKVPPRPSRTIRRRSYKNFVAGEFLQDLGDVDWTDVLTSCDLDTAVDLFTEKFKSVLNKHAPWIIFQLRKSYCPWLTEEIIELMKIRDSWKAKAKELAAANPDRVTEEQKAAWGEYKRFRNKINNVKGKEERLYKQQKVKENMEDTAKVWEVTKTFMGWKSTGSPTQLEEKGKLITSAKVISQIMNGQGGHKPGPLHEDHAGEEV